MWAWVGDFERMSDPDYFGSPDHNLLLAIVALLNVLYFAVPEGLWGASPGKAICGVRVVNPRRNAAGVPRALARAAVYVVFPQAVTLACAGFIGAGVISRPPMWLLQLLGYSSFAMLALMFSTARRRNGYAGFQDLVSDTRVVLKSVYQPRPVLPSDGEPPEETEATPTVGPYHVLSSLDKTDDAELLLGYDTRLLRKVWIRSLPDDAPAVATDVRDLARPGRLRWLAGRRRLGECWDAYEDPSGSPMVHLLEEPQPWESVRYWLVDVAEELAAGTKHQSLPAVLTLDRVWITPEGRAKLLDFPHRALIRKGLGASCPSWLTTSRQSMGALLNSVAIAALEGRAVEPEEACRRAVAAPLPLHAKSVLDELPTIDGPEPFARRLKPLLGRDGVDQLARNVWECWRSPVAALLLAAILLGGMAKAFKAAEIAREEMPSEGQGIVELQNRRWLERHPEATPLVLLSGRAEEVSTRQTPRRTMPNDNNAGPGGLRRRSVRQDDFRSGRLVQSVCPGLLQQDKRKIAQRAVKNHPDPAEEEVTEAAARLGPFLDEMPDELPGVREFEERMPVFLVFLAVGIGVLLMVVPSVIWALLFRGGPLMYVSGIDVVAKDGSRPSRLRTVWRSLVAWSPCVLLPILLGILKPSGLETTWAAYVVLALLIALIAWSVSLPGAWYPRPNRRHVSGSTVGCHSVPR